MSEEEQKDTRFSSDYQPPTRGTPDDMTRGRKDKKIMTDALLVALKREVKDADGKPTKRLTQIAEKLASKAGDDGDTQAIKEVFDRTEGKPDQSSSIDVSGKMSLMQLLAADGKPESE